MWTCGARSREEMKIKLNQEPENLRLVAEDDDELLCTIGHSPRDNPPLLPSSIQEVDAVCQGVKRIQFSGDRDPKLEFTFQVVEPKGSATRGGEYVGSMLGYSAKNIWTAESSFISLVRTEASHRSLE